MTSQLLPVFTHRLACVEQALLSIKWPLKLQYHAKSGVQLCLGARPLGVQPAIHLS